MNYTWPSTKHLFKNKNLFFIYKKIKKNQANIPMFVQRHGRSQNEDPANKLETFAISL